MGMRLVLDPPGTATSPSRLTAPLPLPTQSQTWANGWTVTAADTPPRREGAPSEPLPGRRFHAVIAVEDSWTGDGRYWNPGAFTWRDLPLPVMATDQSPHGPGDVPPSITIGTADRIERHGNEIHAWGTYVDNGDPEVVRLIGLIDAGHLRAVSIDGDDVESEVIIPAAAMAEPVENDDGDLVIVNAPVRERFTHTRIIGFTVIPFPAIDDTFIASDDPALLTAALAAACGITGIVRHDPVVASGTDLGMPLDVPVVPRSAWFDDLDLDAPTPWTVTASGELYGHLATWGTCHIGSQPGECITPPRTAAGYRHFTLGEIVVDDGTRVQVGKITMSTGHADLRLGGPAAAAHYDHTGTVVAHVRVGEDRHGIWVHGALMPGLTPVQVRTLMGSDLSGDWRRIDGNLELVAALAVNVPGFPKPHPRTRAARCRVRTHAGIVASLVASLPIPEPASIPGAVLDDPTHQAVVERIAATIGRSTTQRIAQLAARVHRKER